MVQMKEDATILSTVKLSDNLDYFFVINKRDAVGMNYSAVKFTMLLAGRYTRQVFN